MYRHWENKNKTRLVPKQVLYSYKTRLLLRKSCRRAQTLSTMWFHEIFLDFFGLYFSMSALVDQVVVLSLPYLQKRPSIDKQHWHSCLDRLRKRKGSTVLPLQAGTTARSAWIGPTAARAANTACLGLGCCVLFCCCRCKKNARRRQS